MQIAPVCLEHLCCRLVFITTFALGVTFFQVIEIKIFVVVVLLLVFNF